MPCGICVGCWRRGVTPSRDKRRHDSGPGTVRMARHVQRFRPRHFAIEKIDADVLRGRCMLGFLHLYSPLLQSQGSHQCMNATTVVRQRDRINAGGCLALIAGGRRVMKINLTRRQTNASLSKGTAEKVVGCMLGFHHPYVSLLQCQEAALMHAKRGACRN
jgi:hypothetical protein